MSNFIKLVDLVEQNIQDEGVAANNASSFLIQKYSKLAQDYNDKYKANYSFIFPSEEDYKGLIYSATQASVRTVKDSDRYPNIKQIFPILDLVGLVTQSYYKGARDASTTAETRYDDFIRKLKASPGAPLEYEPMSPWAKSVKDDYFSGKQKIDIGKLRLESPELQNQSIYFVVQKLFQLRMTGKANVLNLADPNIPKKSQQFIDQFLFNPNAFINGQKPVPDQQIKALYNDVTPSLILEIARNAYEFFVQQADVNVGGIKNLKGATGASVDAFKLFLNNKLDWKMLDTDQNTKAPSLQTNGLTNFTKSINKLLNEMSVSVASSDQGRQNYDSIFGPKKGDTVIWGSGYGFEFDGTHWTHEGNKVTKLEDIKKINKKWKEEKQNNPQTNQSSSQNNPQTNQSSSQNNSPGSQANNNTQKTNSFIDENGKANYNLQNIIKHKAEVPAANNLYSSLAKLADYLRKQGEGMNWGKVFDAISGIAQGLSMGVPTLGSKR